MKKPTKTKLIRSLIQLASFILFPGLFAITFSGIGSIITAIATQTFSLATNGTTLLLTLGILIITAIFGRFFCGFICSFGASQDLFFAIGKLLKIPSIHISEKLSRLLTPIKYILLALISVLIWIAGLSFSSNLSPWSVFGEAITFNNPDFTALLSIGGFILIAIMLSSIFFERFFCRYLCPLGGLLALASHFRIFRIRKPSEKCASCKLCTSNCPMGIPLYSSDKVTSDECINCLNCTAVCPRNNCKANPLPAVSASVAVLSIAGFRFLATLDSTSLSSSNSSSLNSSSLISSFSNSSSLISSSTDVGPYTDGTYSGSANGYRGTTSLTVTISNGNIDTITIDSYEDDSEFFNRAKNTIIDEIITSQSLNVDTVTGATFSSNGIIAAVTDALSNALSDSSSISSSSTSSNSSSLSSSSSSSSSSSDSTNVVSDAGSYTDGTYTGTGTGLRGDTNVTVTVSNGVITSIIIDSYEDDEQYFSRAQNTIIDEILSSQSTSVSTVSGATFSSNGILEAVSDALGIDFTNPNSSLSGEGGSGFGGHHRH